MRFTPICEEAVEAMVEQLPGPDEMRLKAWSAVHRILHRCQREEGYFKGVKLARGEFPFGLEELGKSCYLSIQEIRTILKHLEKARFLTSKRTNKGSIGTVIEFDTYVIDLNGANKQANKQLTSSQQAANNTLKGERGKGERKDTSSDLSEDERKPGDDYEIDMVEYWDMIAPTFPIPWKQFDLWRKNSGEAIAVTAALHCATIGKEPDDPVTYLPSLFRAAAAGELSTQRNHHPALPAGSPHKESTEERLARRRREREERDRAA